MTPNPYAPPHGPIGPPASPAGVRLFTAVAIVIHFLIVPPFGAILAATNYRRLRDKQGTWRSFAQFVAPAFALVWFGAAAHNRWQVLLIWAAQLGLAAAVFRDQRLLVRKHFAAGGRKARWLLAWLVALPAFIVFLALWQIFDPGAVVRPHGL